MDASLVAFLGLVLLLIVLDVAALRFGVDSRDGARESPLAAGASDAGCGEQKC